MQVDAIRTLAALFATGAPAGPSETAGTLDFHRVMAGIADIAGAKDLSSAVPADPETPEDAQDKADLPSDDAGMAAPQAQPPEAMAPLQGLAPRAETEATPDKGAATAAPARPPPLEDDALPGSEAGLLGQGGGSDREGDAAGHPVGDETGAERLRSGPAGGGGLPPTSFVALARTAQPIPPDPASVAPQSIARRDPDRPEAAQGALLPATALRQDPVLAVSVAATGFGGSRPVDPAANGLPAFAGALLAGSSGPLPELTLSPMAALPLVGSGAAPVMRLVEVPVPASLTQQVVQGASQLADGTIELRLEPEELGRLRLSLLPEGDRMRVVILAERPETLDLLRRHSPELERDLRSLGFDTTEFRFAGEDRAGSEGARRGQAFVMLADGTPMPDTSAPPLPSLHSGRLDLRL